MPVGRIRDCADIFSGYTFRVIPPENPEGTIIFVQLKDVDQGGCGIVYDNALTISEFDGGGKHFLRQGDILLGSKGKSTPVIVFEERPQKVVASSAFIIIRPFTKAVNPDYLNWYLQLPVSQHYLQSSKAGATVLNLSIKSVQDWEIDLPSIDTQEKIGKVHRLFQQQSEKQFELIAKERLLLNHSMYQLLKK